MTSLPRRVIEKLVQSDRAQRQLAEGRWIPQTPQEQRNDIEDAIGAAKREAGGNKIIEEWPSDSAEWMSLSDPVYETGPLDQPVKFSVDGTFEGREVSVDYDHGQLTGPPDVIAAARARTTVDELVLWGDWAGEATLEVGMNASMLLLALLRGRLRDVERG